jgi:hypothetical protein
MAILLDRYLIAGLFPWAAGLAGVNPMLVFFDIPVPLPVVIDLPVIGLFFFFYWILLLSYPSRYGAATWPELRKRLWSLFTGGLAILLCLAAGGAIFYLCSGLMSREVRNGIDSFGIQADLYTPIPDHEIIHLRGGMILLVCFFIGMRIFMKRTRRTWILAEPGIAGSRTPGAPDFSGKLIDQGKDFDLRKVADPGKVVDPRIAGFQEKERRMGGWEEVSVPEKAKTAATSVPVVAPSRVNIN